MVSVEVVTRNIRFPLSFSDVDIECIQESQTAFKALRLAKILIARAIVIVKIDIQVTGRHSATLKVKGLLDKWRGDGLQLVDSASCLTEAIKVPCSQQTNSISLASTNCCDHYSGETFNGVALYVYPVASFDSFATH